MSTFFLSFLTWKAGAIFAGFIAFTATISAAISKPEIIFSKAETAFNTGHGAVSALLSGTKTLISETTSWISTTFTNVFFTHPVEHTSWAFWQKAPAKELPYTIWDVCFSPVKYVRESLELSAQWKPTKVSLKPLLEQYNTIISTDDKTISFFYKFKHFFFDQVLSRPLSNECLIKSENIVVPVYLRNNLEEGFSYISGLFSQLAQIRGDLEVALMVALLATFLTVFRRLLVLIAESVFSCLKVIVKYTFKKVTGSKMPTFARKVNEDKKYLDSDIKTKWILSAISAYKLIKETAGPTFFFISWSRVASLVTSYISKEESIKSEINLLLIKLLNEYNIFPVGPHTPEFTKYLLELVVQTSTIDNYFGFVIGRAPLIKIFFGYAIVAATTYTIVKSFNFLVYTSNQIGDIIGVSLFWVGKKIEGSAFSRDPSDGGGTGEVYIPPNFPMPQLPHINTRTNTQGAGPNRTHHGEIQPAAEDGGIDRIPTPDGDAVDGAANVARHFARFIPRAHQPAPSFLNSFTQFIMGGVRDGVRGHFPRNHPQVNPASPERVFHSPTGDGWWW